MIDLKSYIESGVLESYILGSLSETENAEVLFLLTEHPELQKELDVICQTMEDLCFENAVTPDPTIKPFFMATIDYTTRLQNGEVQTFPPTLNENSKISDFAEWIDRPDMTIKDELEDFYAKIIGYTPTQVTAITWIKDMAPTETHSDEYEKFLILEGTCDIRIGAKIHHLKAGDYLAIPLHVDHQVTITSLIPCKVILQRIAC